MKPKVFFFHYNKPASQRSGVPKMSIHFEGKCHIVDCVTCHVMCYTYHKKTQPRCVMKGKCLEVLIRKESEGKLDGIIR